MRFDPQRVQALEDEGVAGNGPFYALGEAMSRQIVQELGAPELGRCLANGAPYFFQRYLKATRKAKKPNLLGPALTQAVMALK